MYSKFFSLEKDKQDRIINAAIKEFARKGYALASTNEMVKEARISKGLLFHYFGNKKQLFLFLYDYCIELVSAEIYQKLDLTETDLFVRLRNASLSKMDVMNMHPGLFKFLERAYMEDAEEVKQEIGQKNLEITKMNAGRIYEGFDMTKFRGDVDLQKALKIVTWTFEKLGEEAIYKAKLISSHELDYKEIFKEADQYLQLFKKCFYK